MQKDYKKEGLLREHEELVNLYMHKNRIKWNLLQVYIALSVGLGSAAVVLITNATIERLVAVSVLCFVGGLYSASASLVFRRNQNQTRELIHKGREVENRLKKEEFTLEVFKSCINSWEEDKHPKILNGMRFLTFLWFLIGTVIIFEKIGLIDIPFFP